MPQKCCETTNKEYHDLFWFKNGKKYKRIQPWRLHLDLTARFLPQYRHPRTKQTAGLFVFIE